MRTKVPEKLLAIVAEIEATGSSNLTRLTVLKKWFQAPGRQSAFGLWVASRAASRKGKTAGVAGELFKESRLLLKDCRISSSGPDHALAKDLHNRLRAFQNEYDKQRWGPVRIINNWNLHLVEQGLAIYLWHADKPGHGYDLARDYCRHYDPHCFDDLNGPSRTKILDIVRFMFVIEAREGDNV